ncbi:MAG: RHS repeat domain-containing protein [Bryobacteraceae bacterium]
MCERGDVGTGTPFAFSCQYNDAGGLVAETYPSQRVISTTYDALNRPTGVTGSRAPSGPQTPFLTTDQESSVAAVFPNNHWNGASYNVAGNMTSAPGRSFTFTAEGLVQTATVGTTLAQYSYDGLGRRVQNKVVGAPPVTTTFAVDASGTVAAEYTLGAPLTPIGV